MPFAHFACSGVWGVSDDGLPDLVCKKARSMDWNYRRPFLGICPLLLTLLACLDPARWGVYFKVGAGMILTCLLLTLFVWVLSS